MAFYTLRSLLSRRRRAALTALAVVLGVAMVSGTFVFTDTIHGTYRSLFTGQAKGAEVVVASRQGIYSATSPPANMPSSLQNTIAKLPGVTAAEGQTSDVATIVGRRGRLVKSTGLATLALSYLPQPFGGVQFVKGGPPTGSGQVVLDQSTAEREGNRVGDSVPIVTGQPVRRFTVSGIARVGNAAIAGAPFAVFDLSTAQALYDKQGELNVIYVSGGRGITPATLERQIKPLLPAQVTVQTVPQAVDADLDQVGDRLQVLTGGLLAFGFIAVFVGAFVIFNTLSITVAQRMRELALVRALGATPRQVLGSVLLEAGVIGILASVVGMLVGLAAAVAIRAVLKAAGLDLPSTGLVVEPRTVLVSLGTGVIVTLAAGLPPAYRATRAAPVEALRETTAPSHRARMSWATTGSAAVLALVGIVLVFTHASSVDAQLTSSTIGAVMLVLAAVLLSPLAVPSLSRVVAWPIARGGRIIGALARENTNRTPARTAVTASSLMIGLALVLFVSVYVDGIRTSTKRAINSTFIADFAIENQDGTSSIPAASTRALAVVPDIEAVSSVKSASAQVPGAGTVTAAGVDPTTIGDVYRFNWVDGPGPDLQNLTTDDLLVEQDTARAAHLRIGQHLKLSTPSGASAELTVAGIYADRALLRGVALPLPEFDQLFHQDQLQEVFVKLLPGSNRGAAQAGLQQALTGLPGVVVRSERQLANEASHQVNGVLVLFYALLAMSAVMALLGLLNALTLSIHERTHELGVLRAIGMTPEQARTLIRDESMITAAIGTLIGLVLGVVMAWIVSHALHSEGVVFAIPWPQVGLLLVVGLLVGVLAAGPPAARVARLDVLTAIGYE